jgi:hypothetical protein
MLSNHSFQLNDSPLYQIIHFPPQVQTQIVNNNPVVSNHPVVSNGLARLAGDAENVIITYSYQELALNPKMDFGVHTFRLRFCWYRAEYRPEGS